MLTFRIKPVQVNPCRFIIIAFAAIIGVPEHAAGQSAAYFPPSEGVWETIPHDSLGWCPENTAALLEFAESTNTRALIILKDGRIALESYMNGFQQDSLWYWASAAKTVTATLAGIAQQEGYLDIQQPVSHYLGTDWTDCTPEEEAQRTVFHQLTMSSGFNPAPWFWDCTDPECFSCFTEPGTSWHYHNGVYRRLIEVIEAAASTTRNIYTTQKIKDKIGMQGFWFDNLFISRARDMARFGLLACNDFVWNGDSILTDIAYADAMRNTALQANPAYGYLWWLNGKDHYLEPMVDQPQDGWIVPSAPADMYAGMGANDQRMYIAPSEGLVVIRMGDVAYEESMALSGFDDELWQRIAELPCAGLSAEHSPQQDIRLSVYPNPSSGFISIRDPEQFQGARIYTTAGKKVWAGSGRALAEQINLGAGVYIIEAYHREGGTQTAKIIVY